MNKRILFRFLMVLVAGVVLSACAHEGPKLTDGLAGEVSTTNESLSGDGVSPSASTDEGDVTSLQSAVTAPDSNTSDNNARVQAPTESSDSADKNLDSEMEKAEQPAAATATTDTAVASNKEAAPTTEAAPENKDAAAAPLLEDSSRTTASTEAAQAAEVPPSTDVPPSTEVPPSTDMATQDAATAQSSAMTTPDTTTVQAPSDLTTQVADATNPAVTRHKTKKHSKAATTHVVAATATPAVEEAKLASVPTKPMDKNGTSLNRYYFLRRGDNPETVSNRLYGNASRANDLRSWNNGRLWQTGQWIVYASPSNQEDPEMHSYFEDQSMAAELVVVSPGETLERLAQKHYGDPESWKEIALMNNLTKASEAKPGMQIKLFPSKLPERAQIDTPDLTASNPNSTATAIATATPPSAPPVVASTIPTEEKPVTKAPLASKPVLANAEVGGGFFQRHPEALAGAMAAASVALFAFFFYRRRKNDKDTLEFPE